MNQLAVILFVYPKYIYKDRIYLCHGNNRFNTYVNAVNGSGGVGILVINDM